MRRLLVWCAFVAALVSFGYAVGQWRNPWARPVGVVGAVALPPLPVAPSAAALFLPSCANRPECDP